MNGQDLVPRKDHPGAGEHVVVRAHVNRVVAWGAWRASPFQVLGHGSVHCCEGASWSTWRAVSERLTAGSHQLHLAELVPADLEPVLGERDDARRGEVERLVGVSCLAGACEQVSS